MRVLVADPDPARCRRVVTACASRGLTVETVDDGAEALQRALADPPDLLVCPVPLAPIDARKLGEILRNNPRTSEIRFLYLVEDELDTPVGMDVRDRFVTAPWRDEDIARQVDGVLERGPQSRGPEPVLEREPPIRDPAPGGEGIEGTLAQISLVDLLQVFHINKKNGTVYVIPENGTREGTIVLRGGEVVDAVTTALDGQPIAGVKALFRLLGFRDGRFEFRPEDPGRPPRILESTRALLMEGLRQLDEAERFRESLPPAELRVRLAGEGAPPEEPENALSREVLRCAAERVDVQGIVDRVPFPDYQVLRTLDSLLRRGLVEIDHDAAPTGEVAGEDEPGLLSKAEAGRIVGWAATQRPPISSHVRVPVVFADGAALDALLEALVATPGVRPLMAEGESPEGRDRVRTLADLPVGDGISVRLVSIPADERFRPVWHLAAHGMLGGVVLLSEPIRTALSKIDEARAVLVRESGRIVHVWIGDRDPAAGAEGLALDGPMIPLPASGSPAVAGRVRDLMTALVP